MSPGSERTRPRSQTAGKYDLLRKLGSGAFGSVFEARDRETGLPFAVKRIQLSEDDAERFRKEALYPASVANLSMHVMSVHSFFQDDQEGYFYMVTEFIPHGDLRDFLDREPKSLPVRQALEVALGIARGLAAIHEQKIVHRDLKPRNILMDRKDDRWIPKIADFGLARSSGSVSVGAFASAGYAAPEQLDLGSIRAPGPESDLFSYGMILYELLTGARPTEAAGLREYGQWLAARNVPAQVSHVRPQLARWPQLDALVAGLIEFDRDVRTARAESVVRSLERILRQVDVQDGGTQRTAEPLAPTPRGRTHPDPLPRSDRWPWWIPMGATMAGILVLVFFVTSSKRPVETAGPPAPEAPAQVKEPIPAPANTNSAPPTLFQKAGEPSSKRAYSLGWPLTKDGGRYSMPKLDISSIFPGARLPDQVIIVNRINAQLDGVRFDPETVRLQSRDLAFYPGYRLVDLRSQAGDLRQFVLYGPGKLYVLNLSDAPLIRAGAEIPVRLTRENVHDYAVFYFTYVRGRHARFIVAERGSDVNWKSLLNDRDAYIKDSAIRLIRPTELRSVDQQGVFHLKSYMIFQDSLFTAGVDFKPDGTVTLHDEELIVENLPVLEDTFGPLPAPHRAVPANK